ncbi:TIGR03089 family protein [Luteococcus sp. Sow4_B9]|uniref:TIGR03089 family protein n=1 Tax=Luteococcus sp. Sow4_B9 TaxID=3438792 RepID=UPI003F960AFF
MSSTFDPVAALEQRVVRDGARPLLTCYDLDDDSRVEFSARTFANWVDKTANLIGSMGLEEGDDIGLPLLLTHPGHWVTLVWTMASWQYGNPVLALPRDDLDRVELAVVGPTHAHPVPGVETVACSLHPLGLGLNEPAAGVTDFAEALSQPDMHWRNDPPAVWFDDGETRLDQAALDAVESQAERRLFLPGGEPWQDLVHGLLGALRGGGSVVVVRGTADADRIEAIAAAEHASAQH